MADSHGFFISYRRDLHRELAESVADCLRTMVGGDRVFMDQQIQSLPPGSVWPRQIVRGLRNSSAVLAIIDDRWFHELECRNKRADRWLSWKHSDDWVRYELCLALMSGKTVIPVLAGSGARMREDLLTPELKELATRQCCTLQDSENLADQLQQLLQWLPSAEAVHGGFIGRFVSEAGPTYMPAEAVTDADGGELWDPATETDSPQVMDFKFSIFSGDYREKLKIEFLLGSIRGALPTALQLEDLRLAGQPRKFRHSSRKKGMFLQCSCVLTDGLDSGIPEHVLLSVRSTTQFHDPGDVRNIQGVSCLIATCMSDFGFHDNELSLPIALLDDLARPNRWAVFSRKLLMPDSLIESRFLGAGFNFATADKEYLHLVWHIRVRQKPPVLLVPQRQKSGCDVPVWTRIQDLAAIDFSEAPIDAAVLAHLFPEYLSGEASSVAGFHGFLESPGMAGRGYSGGGWCRFARDTVAVDLTLMFQQAVHRGQWNPADSGPGDMLKSFADYTESLRTVFKLPFAVEALQISGAEPPYDRALWLNLIDDRRNVLRRYCVISSQSLEQQPTDWMVTSARRIAERVQTDTNGAAAAIIVLNPVQTDDRVSLHNPLSVHRRNETPIHLIQIAMGDMRIPRREVVHALIVLSEPVETPERWLLFTRSAGDQRWRLPGGKIEGIETPDQALVRELAEELRLGIGDFELSREIVPGGITSFEHSPKTGRLTHYSLHPFLVHLRSGGIARVTEQLNCSVGQPCELRLVAIHDWCEHGVGFDPGYAQAVLSRLAVTEVQQAASVLSAVPASCWRAEFP